MDQSDTLGLLPGVRLIAEMIADERVGLQSLSPSAVFFRKCGDRRSENGFEISRLREPH
jgi:hypothetical protein